MVMRVLASTCSCFFFFFNDTATTEIYTLSLHDALPIYLNYFTKATLAKLVDPRFSVIEFRSTHFNPIVIWQDWRSGGQDISNRERADLLQRTTSYKQNPLL